jgi:hypothetical protein
VEGLSCHWSHRCLKSVRSEVRPRLSGGTTLRSRIFQVSDLAVSLPGRTSFQVDEDSAIFIVRRRTTSGNSPFVALRKARADGVNCDPLASICSAPAADCQFRLKPTVFDKILRFTWHRAAFIVALWALCVVLHNAVYAMLHSYFAPNGDEVLFFVLAILVLPLFTVVSAVYSAVALIRRRSATQEN